jgi:hypothetical protein
MELGSVLVQIGFAIGRGADRTRVGPEACRWLARRYVAWLGTRSVGGTALELWDSRGDLFLDRFGKIGRVAARIAAPQPIDETAIAAASLTVERHSTCPWCPHRMDLALEDPSRIDAVMVEIACAIGRNARVSLPASQAARLDAWCREWLGTVGPSGEPMLDVWDARRAAFLARFDEIGRLAGDGPDGFAVSALDVM